MKDPRVALRTVFRDGRDDGFDRVVVEEPLEIRVSGEPIAVTMRTPGDDFDLAAGFLCTEGVVRAPSDLRALVQAERNVIDVGVAEEVDVGPARRALYSASSCGLCGKGSIAAITVHVPPIEDDVRATSDELFAAASAMRGAQRTFEATGGLHAAALFHRGELEVIREDVGRHNATDKVIGARVRDDAPLSGRVLLVSGRAGFEIVQKAAVARIPIVAAVSAPSSLAIDLAHRVGITLVGFLRPPRASVYTHPARVVSSEPA